MKLTENDFFINKYLNRLYFFVNLNSSPKVKSQEYYFCWNKSAHSYNSSTIKNIITLDK